MKEVTGFLTEDGTFLSTKAAAEFHEAEQELREQAVTLGINPDKLMGTVWELRTAVRRYLDAKDEITDTDDDAFPESRDQASLDRENPGQPQAAPADLQHEPPSRG